jgi:hypothetical protein
MPLGKLIAASLIFVIHLIRIKYGLNPHLFLDTIKSATSRLPYCSGVGCIIAAHHIDTSDALSALVINKIDALI